nr:reverse transcriptase domain-containing protein [Tanacetum cinerariifolium]
MSSSPHSTIVPSDSDIENNFSSTNILNYFSASLGSISPDSSNNFTKYLLDILVFLPLHDDLKIEVIQAYDTIPQPQVVIALTAILPPSLVLSLSLSLIPKIYFLPRRFHLKTLRLLLNHPFQYLHLHQKDLHHQLGQLHFDESIFAKLDNSLWIISRPLGSKPMPPKRTSTSTTPAMTEATIRQLITEGVAAALEAQAAAMANADNPNRNTRPREIPIVKRVKKMEDEFYNLVVKGDDLKTYVRRFQELAVLSPNMIPNTKKIMEAFIGGLTQIIKGNITALKPQTLEEATNISHRLIDQILKHKSIQETNDHKKKFDDMRNTTINNNNYPNDHDNNNYPNTRNNNNHSNNHIDNNNYQDNRNNNNRNNDHHQQQNRRQETLKANGNHGYNIPHPLYRKCTLHYIGPCTVRCQNYHKVGHQTRNCMS